MKRFFVFLAIVVCSLAAMAQEADDNIIYFNDTEIEGGKQYVLPLMMDNKAEITALQFDVVMPEGVTLNKNSRGKYMVSFNAAADRTDATIHTLSSSLQTDGSIRVLCYSTVNDPILGNSGALMDFSVSVAEGIGAGEHQIQLKNIVVTDTKKNQYKPGDRVCKLTVKGNEPVVKIGDINEDGEVDVYDYVKLLNYIGKGGSYEALPTDRDRRRYDVNGDDMLNIADCVATIIAIMRQVNPDYGK